MGQKQAGFEQSNSQRFLDNDGNVAIILDDNKFWSLRIVTNWFNNFIKSNVMYSFFLGKSGVAKEFAQYIPELIYINGLNDRGMEILKITHIYELIINENNK